MDEKPPLEVLGRLGYNGLATIAAPPPFLLDEITTELTLAFRMRGSNDLLATCSARISTRMRRLCCRRNWMTQPRTEVEARTSAQLDMPAHARRVALLCHTAREWPAANTQHQGEQKCKAGCIGPSTVDQWQSTSNHNPDQDARWGPPQGNPRVRRIAPRCRAPFPS